MAPGDAEAGPAGALDDQLAQAAWQPPAEEPDYTTRPCIPLPFLGKRFDPHVRMLWGGSWHMCGVLGVFMVQAEKVWCPWRPDPFFLAWYCFCTQHPLLHCCHFGQRLPHSFG